MAKTKERADKRAGGKHPGGQAGERTDRNGAGPVGDPEHLVELSFFLMLSVTACKATAVLTDEKPFNRRLTRKLPWRQSVLQKLGPRDRKSQTFSP